MGNWKEELLQLAPMMALAAGAWVALVGWLVGYLRNRRAARALRPQQEDITNFHPWMLLSRLRNNREPREIPAVPGSVVLEGTLLGDMLAVTVVSIGTDPIQLPEHMWDLEVGDRWYTVKLMTARGDRLDEIGVGELDRDPILGSRPEPEYRSGIFDGEPLTSPPYRSVDNRGSAASRVLTQNTAFVVSGVTDEDAENVVATLQRELNGSR